MPSIKISPRIAAWLVALAVAGCAGLAHAPAPQDSSQLPRDIRNGVADMVLQPVEHDVSPDEVNAALTRLVSSVPICMTWPSLWLDEGSTRTTYRVRFDLMKRDWGVPVANASEQRMNEFVDMGFLTKRARDDIGPGTIEYGLTNLGSSYQTGSPYGSDRPTFCAPSERQLVAVTQMEWGDFPCGNLRVHFLHQAPDAPSWAHSAAARTRAAQNASAAQQGEGVVTLARQWFRPSALPAGATNGALQSICYDRSHRNVTGNDLNLNAGGS